jgi:hypothetical protein
MSIKEIRITNKAGELIRAIAVPPEGITVADLARHLSEERASGNRPGPYDRVTLWSPTPSDSEG